MRRIVGIFGISGAGKSTLCMNMKAKIKETTILSQDSFYRDNLNEKSNFDNPESLDIDLIIETISCLRNGIDTVRVPIYNFNFHKRMGFKEIECGDLIIFEGHMFPLAFDCREIFDYLIYYDTPLDVAMIRRIRRDIKDRGRSLDSVLEQYQSSVRDTALKIIEASTFADLRVSDDSNNLEEIINIIKK